jgi:uncharacterized membrane protein
MARSTSQRPLIAAAMTLGIGLGGFIDGIVFHQILQLHNMLSARLPPVDVVSIEINMFWDGVFHAACWVICVLGLGMLWNTVKASTSALSTRTFVGSLLAGWGLFNIVEGVIDHHILHLHHVTETAGHLTWDIAFLGSSLIVLGMGGWLIRDGTLDTSAGVADPGPRQA